VKLIASEVYDDSGVALKYLNCSGIDPVHSWDGLKDEAGEGFGSLIHQIYILNHIWRSILSLVENHNCWICIKLSISCERWVNSYGVDECDSEGTTVVGEQINGIQVIESNLVNGRDINEGIGWVGEGGRGFNDVVDGIPNMKNITPGC
jgi:hypothetical protein